MDLSHRRLAGWVILGGSFFAALCFISLSNYLLFHSLAEMFGIVIACMVFVVGWNARRSIRNNYFILLAVAYLFVGVIDLLHTLAYKGMGIFPAHGANLPTQLWIAARSLETAALLIAPLLINRGGIQPRVLLAGAAAVSTLLVWAVFGGYFPDCYIEGRGLTLFKRLAEYSLCLLLVLAWLLLYRQRARFDTQVARMLLASIALTTLGELAFTFYVSVYGLSNLVGHLIKILSFLLIYKAVVETGISRPRELLYRELEQSRRELAKKATMLEKAESLANLGAWEWDMVNDSWILSLHWRWIHGFNRKRVTTPELMALAFPEDAAAVEEALRKAVERGERYDIRHRIVRADTKEVRHVHSVGEVEFSPETGAPVRMVGAAQDITGQVKNEEKAVAQSSRLEAFMNAIQEAAFLIDTKGVLLHVNQAFGRRFGMEGENLVGRNIADFLPEGLVPQRMDNVRQVVRGGKPLQAEDVRGGYILNNFLYPVIDTQTSEVTAIAVLSFDVTEIKRKERELTKLRRSVENSPATIVITDTNGIIEYVNPAFTHITGYTREEAIGANPRILKSGAHDQTFYNDLWRTIASGRIWRDEMCNRKKNGEFFWEQVSISPVKNEQGEVTNYVAVKEDISDKKELERLKDDVERIMRHDLRAPLSVIISIPQLLKMEDTLTAEQAELVNAVEDSGRRMLSMIDMSLNLFKMETGSYTYIPNDVDAVAVINKLIWDYQGQFPTNGGGVSLTVNGEPAGDSFWIKAERELLHSMLSNLVINAMEASPEGERVFIAIEEKPHPSISISNRGAVPGEIREHFFHKYKTYGKKKGTGLGTYSAKLMADTMGYGIRMDTSDEENSTIVSIDIPQETRIG